MAIDWLYHPDTTSKVILESQPKHCVVAPWTLAALITSGGKK
jgi:hypothetical protein